MTNRLSSCCNSRKISKTRLWRTTPKPLNDLSLRIGSLLNADGRIVEKDRFLAVVKSGTLTHDTMKLDEPRVRVYGETAVVTGCATSAGKFMGAEFKTLERATDVFVRINGQWRCVLTQLTRVAENKTG